MYCQITREVAPIVTLQGDQTVFPAAGARITIHDKNNGDHLSAALFREVQEAWEVLSDPALREEYNYKRWYSRSIGEAFVEKALSPDAIWPSAKAPALRPFDERFPARL